MLLMSIGIMNGESRPGPRSSKILTCAVVVSSPPMPEPRMTPISSRLTLSRSTPESLSACQPAWTPNCEIAVRAADFLGRRKRGRQDRSPCTSPAIWVSKPVASNAVMRSMPHWPAMRSLPERVEVIAQRRDHTQPVTTTLRSCQLLAIKSNGAAQAASSRNCPEIRSVTLTSAGLRRI